MKKNKGSISAILILFSGFIMLFMLFFGVALFEIVITGELHEIKNDLYLINRNVLMALNHEVMGEDINSFYELEVKKLVEEEIKRLWNVDVSSDTTDGKFAKIDVIDAKIVDDDKRMYIESLFRINLRPVLFGEILKDKLVFIAKERVKVEKMRGWSDE